MSRQINQPVGQIRLTNVAVVRMNMGGKRFEIACYRNKVVNYRQGLEQDLSEVLQTDRIFTNVSKGEFAKAKDLMKVFNTKDEEEIAKIILTKGQMQVSDKERSQQLEKTNAQIAEWICQNCVHPQTDIPYTNTQIRHAMQRSNFSVHPTKPLKRQYLDCVKTLQTVIPIVRAKMELMLFVPSTNNNSNNNITADHHHIRVEEAMKLNNVTWDNVSLQEGNDDDDDNDDNDYHKKYRIIVDPSLYRILNEVISTINGGRIEIVNQVVTKQGGDVALGEETTTTKLDNNTLVVVEDRNMTSNDDLPFLEQNVTNLDISVGEDEDDDEDKIENQNNNNKNKNDDDLDDEEGGDSGEDDDEMAMASRSRKQQKKMKKKNKKQQRRAAENNNNRSTPNNSTMIEDTTTTVSQQQRQQRTTTTTTNEASNSNYNSNPPNSASSSTTTTTGPSGRKSCNTCGGFFDTAAEYRSHFKSDWHKYNQKLKLKGVAPIPQEEFLLCDSDTFFNNNNNNDDL